MLSRSVFVRHPNGKIIQRSLLGYLLDLTVFSLSVFLAFELRFDGVLPVQYFQRMWEALFIWTVVKLVAFTVGSVSLTHWRYTSIYEVERIVVVNSAGSILGGFAICLLYGPWGIPRSVYILEWLISCSLILGGRLGTRVIATGMSGHETGNNRTRTIIYGAGDAGRQLAGELRHNPSLMSDLIGFVDDDPRKAGLIFQGKRVLGPGEELGELVLKHKIAMVLIAAPSATGPEMVRILKYATDAEVEHKMVPGLGELVQGIELGKQIRDVAVEDLLGRDQVTLDQKRINQHLQGKVVMVTGAAGSIGSELCRQIARFHPLALVGFDEAETPLFQINRELKRTFPDLVFYPEIGDITRPEHLRQVMRQYKPSALYHAAAYKHVPMMERHVFAAVENNIFGTLNVARAAADEGVHDFVMISTDKAVRPTSMMGATKRVAELVIRAFQKETGTRFVSVRFGNVLGSNGSVVPIFKEQIAEGGPVTVTHPEMCRYFMTIPEASQLVLQASSIGKGGEVFVLDMGEPVKIVDLARNLILLSGFQPDRDIKIEYTGLRPGEKLFEELNLQDEHFERTSHTKIRSFVSPCDVNVEVLKTRLESMQRSVQRREVANLILSLKQLIPDYNPSAQLLEAAMSAQAQHVDPAKIKTSTAQTEIPVAVKLVPAQQIN
jgi:FlaA1/EpsC-like NDP-sugar epimerase